MEKDRRDSKERRLTSPRFWFWIEMNSNQFEMTIPWDITLKCHCRTTSMRAQKDRILIIYLENSRCSILILFPFINLCIETIRVLFHHLVHSIHGSNDMDYMLKNNDVEVQFYERFYHCLSGMSHRPSGISPGNSQSKLWSAFDHLPIVWRKGTPLTNL